MFCINMIPFSKDFLINLNTYKTKHINTFAVLPPHRDIILECIKCGLNEFVLKDNSTQEIEYRILKALNCIPITSINVYSYKYISYIQQNREMYIKQYCVHLTLFESVLLDFTIKNNRYCNIKKFCDYLSALNGRYISSKSVVVSVNRFRKKVIHQTGYNIFLSRYGFGYVLNV